MSAFPGAGAQVYYNEDGEPLGWDYPSEPEFAPDDDDLMDRDQEFECKCGAKFFADDEDAVLDHHEVCEEPEWLVSQFPDELGEI
jgi:hypothetical protein